VNKAIVFGGLGAIGSAVADRFEATGAEVIRTARQSSADAIGVDPFGAEGLGLLDGLGPFDAAVWAQGTNANDSVAELDVDKHVAVLQANVLFISVTLNRLLDAGQLVDGARLCIISSIWQLQSRQDKYSYTVSKAAVAGIVRSAAVDLGRRGMLVNAVLPGVVDTPMTRAMLSGEQLASFLAATTHGRLTTLDDVVSIVGYLCSDENTGVSGQSIAADLGYGIGRVV
jgi:3-oxoacyl-[acyl-carrier protein] reductase